MDDGHLRAWFRRGHQELLRPYRPYIGCKFARFRSIGKFSKTVGWEELFEKHHIDRGPFYASKDNVYPTRQGGTRRVLWGWSIVKPQSTQSLPRVLSFNAKARRLEQAPLEELKELRKERLARAVNSEARLLAWERAVVDIGCTLDIR